MDSILQSLITLNQNLTNMSDEDFITNNVAQTINDTYSFMPLTLSINGTSVGALVRTDMIGLITQTMLIRYVSTA